MPPTAAIAPGATSPSLRRKRPLEPQVPAFPNAPPSAGAPVAARAVLPFLKPPGGDQKPALQKRRAGFSKTPSKPQAKPRFSTKAIGQMPGQEAIDAEAAKAAKAAEVPDSRFVQWLKQGNGERPETRVARNYLLRGAPWLGDHDYEKKEAIRDAGGVWWRNPEKAETCKDRDVRFGWYSAPNERILETLLELEPSEKVDRRGVTGLAYAWRPRECPAPYTGVAILTLLSEYDVDATRRNQEEREEAKRALEERERAQRDRDRASGRAADGDAEIGRLRNEYQVEWSQALSLASATIPCLGPSTGISDVERVLRGLDLDIVRAVDVRALRFDDQTTTTKSRERGPAAEVAGGDEAPLRNYNQQPFDAPVLLFGRKHPWMIRPVAASEWEKARQADLTHWPGGVCRPNRITRCTSCGSMVMAQFGDCACDHTSVHREWAECHTCGAMECGERTQPCTCDREDAWALEQGALRRADEERADRPDADLEDDDPSSGGLVVGGGGSGVECPPALQNGDGNGAVGGIATFSLMDGWLGGNS